MGANCAFEEFVIILLALFCLNQILSVRHKHHTQFLFTKKTTTMIKSKKFVGPWEYKINVHSSC